MKQILSLFVFLLSYVVSFAAVKIDGIYYDLYYYNSTASVSNKGDLSGTYSGSITIPASFTYQGETYSVTSIGENAFFGSSSLSSIEIPNSVTSIHREAFEGCAKLSSITVATGNANYSSLDGVLFNSDKSIIVCYPQAKKGAYTIPNSVTSINERAFSRCSSLTSVEIPSSVTSIGSYAFFQCSSLSSIVIPNSVTSIGSSAFSQCSSLSSIVIPNSVTSIDSNVFSNCSSLSSIVIPSSVTILVI